MILQKNVKYRFTQIVADTTVTINALALSLCNDGDDGVTITNAESVDGLYIENGQTKELNPVNGRIMQTYSITFAGTGTNALLQIIEEI